MLSLSCKASIAILGLFCLLPSAGSAQLFLQTNLVTDDQSVNHAALTDTKLINPWGLSYSGTGPFWVSNNGSSTSTLYSVTPTTNVVTQPALYVNIPGGGSVTGQVFNGSGKFNSGASDVFLFVSEDGTISGWRGALGVTPGTNAETLQAASAANVYKGSALATTGGHTVLYAANFRAGTIDAFQDATATPVLAGKFIDPNLPAGYAPFNVQNLNGTLYVTYAEQDAAKHDELDGTGKGYVDAYDLNGNLLARVGTGGTLDAPWGLAIAPSAFGAYAGDLLVGNFGDGHINAFDLSNDTFVGQLQDGTNNPLSIDGLWALTPGNNGSSGSANRLFFTAGPAGEAHGLFGSLDAVPEPGSVALFAAVCASAGLGFLRRRPRRH